MIAPSEAVDLFAQIYMRGIFYRALALILGPPRRLRRLALAERSGVRRYDGVYSVPLSAIGGSEGRDDFDAGFHPLREDMSKRWLGVAREALRGEHLVPAEGLSKVTGRPFTIAELDRAIDRMLGGHER